MFGFFKKSPKQTPEDIQNMISEGSVVIDVRTPQEFQGGYLKGAVNIPVQIIDSKIAEIKKLNKNNKTVILYCRSGGRAGTAQSVLNQHGIDSINIGGYSDWASSLG